MANTKVQQEAAALSDQFRTLAKYFREIDPEGGYQRVIDHAGNGAKLCKKAYVAGLLDLTGYKRLVASLTEWRSSPQEDLPLWIRDLLLKEYGEIPDQPLDALNKIVESRFDDSKMWPSMGWASTWRLIVYHLSIDHPDELPCNLFVDNSYEAYCGAQAPRNAKTEWRSLAQNYAMVADWLATVMAGVSGNGTPPPNGETANKYDGLDTVKPSEKEAYLSFVYAEAKTERRLEDRDAYDWLNENGIDKNDTGELEDYNLPSFDTWRRYLSTARKATNEQKYTPRKARPEGRSIVHADEIEYQLGEDG